MHSVNDRYLPPSGCLRSPATAYHSTLRLRTQLCAKYWQEQKKNMTSPALHGLRGGGGGSDDQGCQARLQPPLLGAQAESRSWARPRGDASMSVPWTHAAPAPTRSSWSPEVSESVGGSGSTQGCSAPSSPPPLSQGWVFGTWDPKNDTPSSKGLQRQATCPTESAVSPPPLHKQKDALAIPGPHPAAPSMRLVAGGLTEVKCSGRPGRSAWAPEHGEGAVPPGLSNTWSGI